MSTVARLSLESLPSAAPGGAVEMPRVDPRSLTTGIVHLGLGAFARSHQAVFTEDAAAAAGETRWGILGVTGRSDAVVRQLAPQDGLYGVLTYGAARSLRLIGSVRDVAWPGDRSADIVRALAAATTHVVTLTMTEKGYLRGPDGGIDLENADVAHDLVLAERELAGLRSDDPSRTLPGLLVRGLARRFLAGGAPVTVVSCDNLSHNGAATRSMVRSAVAALSGSEPMLGWVGERVTFPSTMVDRITPMTTDADRAHAEALLGLGDEALVVAEPFGQWVIEDSFASDRPAWELAGAIFTDDVAPYETAKLRILNCTHSLLAYLGALMGYETIARAIADPRLRDLAERMITDDVLPTLTPPAGMDLVAYRDSVLERFANPNLAHTTAQVAQDGSAKLPQRLVPTIVDQLSAGVVPQHLALLVAAWAAYIAATPTLADPLADRLRAVVPSTAALYDNPATAVGALLEIESVFPREVRFSRDFLDAVVAKLEVVRDLVAAAEGGEGGA